MTRAIILFAILASAVSGGAQAADPHATSPLQEQCRIWSCRIAEPTVTASLASASDAISVRVGTEDIPVTERTIFAPSTDDQHYACIGYSAFGDPELMCLLVP